MPLSRSLAPFVLGGTTRQQVVEELLVLGVRDPIVTWPAVVTF
jgi:hypothetical protein